MSEHFFENLQRFYTFCPDFTFHSKEVTAQLVQKTEWTPPNWLQSFEALPGSVLLIYGIEEELYARLKPWLQSYAQNTLVFIEDNEERLLQFLSSSTASSLLNDPQVFIKAFHFPQTEDWRQAREELQEVFDAFATRFYQILPSSDNINQIKPESFQLLAQQMTLSLLNARDFFSDVFDWTLLHDYPNFYANLLYAQEACLGETLKQEMQNIPVIICGAGPSLEKQLEQLKACASKALIIAPGTALNILSRRSVPVHLGAGLDATDAQTSRILSNWAFETPFFYVNRFSHDALLWIQADKILYSWNDRYGIANWFEKQLALASQEPLYIGSTTTHFTLEAARQWGANPLVLVGVDLAYTDKRPYTPEIFTHHLDEIKPTAQAENRIPTVDLNGHPIETKWGWVLEQADYTEFAQKYRELNLINATEGGMAIPDVPNRSLKEVYEQLPALDRDLNDEIHALSENGKVSHLHVDSIALAFQKWKQSLQTCRYLLGQGANEKLIEQPAWAYLKEVETAFFRSITLQRLMLRCHSSIFLPEQIKALRAQIEEKRQFCLNRTIELHLSYVENALQEASQWVDLSSAAGGKVKEEIDLSAQYRERFYTTGELKSKSAYRHQHLQGWSYLYTKTGQLVVRAAYVSGVKEGETCWYSRQGNLVSQQRFQNGQKHGLQDYFYTTGQKKMQLSYEEGKLQGKVQFFYPNGQIKRELEFDKGKLAGKEQMWDQEGQLLMQAHYEHNQPVGTSKKWHHNGQLAKQMTFNEQGQCDIYEWDDLGRQIRADVHSAKAALDHVENKSKELAEAIERLQAQLKKVIDDGKS